MSTIEATLEASPKGMLHLPLALRRGTLMVTATGEPMEPQAAAMTDPGLAGFGRLKGKISMAAYFDEPLEDFKDYME